MISPIIFAGHNPGGLEAEAVLSYLVDDKSLYIIN